MFYFSLQAADRPWTVLVYMPADNDLESAAYKDIHEMEKIGSTEKVQVVVQLDAATTSGIQRFRIEKAVGAVASNVLSFESPVIETLPEEDSSDLESFKKFIRFGMSRYPSDHYVLIFWGHGSGWNKEESNLQRGVAFDDSSGSYMSTESLSSALRDLKHHDGFYADDIIFDSCLMGMIETSRALWDLTSYLISSEEVVPEDGFPYDDLLKGLNEMVEIDSLALAKAAVEIFTKSYSYGSQGNYPVTISAVRTSRIYSIGDAVDIWTRKLETKSGLTRDEILEQIGETLTFADIRNRDLGDYVRRVLDYYQAKNPRADRASDEFVASSLDVIDSIGRVVVASGMTGFRYERAAGLAVYLPYNEYGYNGWSSPYSADRSAYRQTRWALVTRWSDHLDFLFP